MQSIARTKRKSNIVEYVLYLWQMEDLLRSVSFNIAELDQLVLSSMPEPGRSESKLWFEQLAADMKDAAVEHKGHHPESVEIIAELALLQQTLLTSIDDQHFKKAYAGAKPSLDELRLKTKNVKQNDVQLALTAVYGVMTLKLAKIPVSPETGDAIKLFSHYLSHLARTYQAMRSGQLPLKN